MRVVIGVKLTLVSLCFTYSKHVYERVFGMRQFANCFILVAAVIYESSR